MAESTGQQGAAGLPPLPDAANVMLVGDEKEEVSVYYLMKGAQSNDVFTWHVNEEIRDEVTVMMTVFEGNLRTGRRYYHESKPIPKEIWKHVIVSKKKYKKGNFKVKLFKPKHIRLQQYFS